MKNSSPFTLKPQGKQLLYNGIYRARVVDNKDPLKFGRIKVFIPDIMFATSQSKSDTIDDNDGLWALPANNQYGGRNLVENDKTIKDQGTCYIPYVNTWVWIFFEKGNPNRPYYLSAFDSHAHKVPPECQIGDEYWNKQLLSRTKKGRVIIISDDPYDERVELTGKKRKYDPNKEDNSNTIFETQDNQTIILIDERDGKEKILIKDYKGNYVNIKQTDDTINIFTHGDCVVHHEKNGEITYDGDVNIHIEGNLNIQVDGDVTHKFGGQKSERIGGTVDIISDGNYNIDAPNIYLNSGTAQPKDIPRNPLLPDGKRDINKPNIKDNFDVFINISNQYNDDYIPRELSPYEYNQLKDKAHQAIIDINNQNTIDQTTKDVLNNFDNHLDNVLDKMKNDERSLIFTNLDDNTNFPLKSYIAHDNNILSNIKDNINNLSNTDVLSNLLYSMSYHLQNISGGILYNIPGIDDESHNEIVNLMHSQCKVINSLFDNMFSQYNDFNKSPKLLNRFKLFNALHVVNNIWDKNYYDYLPELSDFVGFKYTNSYIKTLLPSFSGNEWIHYISEQVLGGHRAPNEIIDDINNTYDNHVPAMLESVDRFLPLLISSSITDEYGPIKDHISKDYLLSLLYKFIMNTYKYADIDDKIKFSKKPNFSGSFNILV